MMGKSETPFPITQWEPILTCRFDDPAEMEKFVVAEARPAASRSIMALACWTMPTIVGSGW